MNYTKTAAERKLRFFALAQSSKGLCLRDLDRSVEEGRCMEQTVHNMRDQGLIFSVEVGWRQTRWFDTRARADAYLAANPFKRVGRDARKQGVRCPAGPAVNTVQVQVCAGIERMHQPVKLTQPYLSALRPGMYPASDGYEVVTVSAGSPKPPAWVTDGEAA